MKAPNILSELPDVCTKQTALFNAKLDPLELSEMQISIATEVCQHDAT